MRLHVRSAALILAGAALALLSALPAQAANPMTLTDLGNVFSPAAGLGVDSPLSAAGSITVVNATGLAHTYRLTDLVTGAAMSPVLIPSGSAHTYGSLRPNTTYAVEQVSGVSQALVLT